MNDRFLFRRAWALSSLCVAALTLGSSALARSPIPPQHDREFERLEIARVSETVAFTFTGVVRSPSGEPAQGAVVVSSAGGEAITDSAGRFQLEARVPREAESVQVTAVGGGKLLASQLVTLVPSTGNVTVAPLQLTVSSTCTPSWLPTFGEAPGTNGTISALAVFDDGNGAALYAGGDFTTAGGVLANYIARWDGSIWATLGSGLDDTVKALTVFDDGSGAALYAAGEFTTAGGVGASGIAKWDGSNWTPLGSGLISTPTNSGVLTLAVFDDGSGAALYAGGGFSTAGGVAVNMLAKWDGSNWAPLGNGMNSFLIKVLALEVFDDGNGAALYAGGFYTLGASARVIAKWDGVSWTALGSGVNGSVLSLTVFDDGSGAALYVGGNFTKAGGLLVNYIARWDGSTWASLGNGMNNAVRAIAGFDDGNGLRLFAGGGFVTAGGGTVNGIAKWDGTNWTTLDTGVYGSVFALKVFDDGGGGEVLFAGGYFATASGLGANNMANWDGSNWTVLGNSFDNGVRELAVYDDGSGPELYAGGSFLTIEGTAVNHIAKWNGSSWALLGSGISHSTTSFGGVGAMTVFDDGTGAALFAAGSFTTAGGVTANNIAKWNGATWTALGGGLVGAAFPSSPYVSTLSVFDDGTGAALYAGGFFTTAGGVTSSNIAKWDGMTWASVGGGTDWSVSALTVFDDGGGAALYAGGDFTTAGGLPANKIAKWDGSNWTAMGSGMNDVVFTLAVHDDGNGQRLFAGGWFTSAGGVPVNLIAKWDGLSWGALGNGFSGGGGSHPSLPVVFSLTTFNDGSGAALYAGGTFTTAGSVAASNIAKWDGSGWTALGSGTNNYVLVLAAFDDGSGAALYAGGSFTSAIDSHDSYLAKWGCVPELFVDHCNGDGSDQLGCTDCPCTNSATPGTVGGCLNSALSSAQLSASGDTSVSLPPGELNDLRFSLSGAPPSSFCILNSGDALAPNNMANPCFGMGSGVQALVFDGLRCILVNERRQGGRPCDVNGEVGVTNNPWGGEAAPMAGIAQLGGGLLVAGQTRYFQVVYRDDPLSVCTRGLNTSQAIEVRFTP